MGTNILRLKADYDLVRIPLRFEQDRYANVFADKNNKTLSETLKHNRYAKFEATVLGRYADFLDKPLGKFLLDIKKQGDTFYRCFLNKYGDLEYSKFSISDPKFYGCKGIYVYEAAGELKYIGRCRDQMKKRINQGYGKIHPKNCYIDGQATNCHLNSLITSLNGELSLWLCEMDDVEEIMMTERTLIQSHLPPWNIQFV